MFIYSLKFLYTLLKKYNEKQPQIRLGQLLVNINHELGGGDDIFNLEDKEIIDYIKKKLSI